MRQRARVVPLAAGRVLEVGIGSGLNLGFYDPARVRSVCGLDPSIEMWNAGRMRRRRSESVPVEFVQGSGERIPLPNASVDSVVVTYSLCTIPDPVASLQDMRRVLRPGGELIFCEHGLAPDPGVRAWQNRLNPVWGLLGGGCNLNRSIPDLLAGGGFAIRALEADYVSGFRPASFNYSGVAVDAFVSSRG